MSTLEGSAVLLDVLSQYFSAPIARALLTSTLRRAKLDGGALAHAAMGEAVQALEHALPLYIADAARRGDCVARLRKLTATSSPEPQHPAPAQAARPAPAKQPVTVASTIIQVTTADDVSNACEVGRDIARRVGFPHVTQTKIATAIAELARNILLYAISGQVRLAAMESPRRGVEVAATDEGPGIPDLELVLSGNYRSRTGMGMGLRGARRLMDTFDITSSPTGTSVIVRKYLA